MKKEKRLLQFLRWAFRRGTAWLFSLVLAMGEYGIAFSQVTWEDWDTAWLFNVPTSYNLAAGQFELDLAMRYTNYRDSRSGVRELIMNANYGVTDRFTLSLWFPFSWLENSVKAFTMVDAELYLKYQVFENENLHVAIAPKLILPTGNKTSLMGTGQVNLIFYSLATYRYNNVWLFSNLGYGKVGYIRSRLRRNPSGSTTLIYYLENEFAVRGLGGLGIKLHPAFLLVLEGTAQVITKNLDKDFYFQAGGIWKLNESLNLKASAGVGVPYNYKTVVKLRMLVAVNYLF